MAVEFLNLNNADNDTQDDDGKTPLHLGTELGNLAQVNLLLKHSAHHYIQES
jgi:ankyrin repeat protein